MSSNTPESFAVYCVAELAEPEAASTLYKHYLMWCNPYTEHLTTIVLHVNQSICAPRTQHDDISGVCYADFCDRMINMFGGQWRQRNAVGWMDSDDMPRGQLYINAKIAQEVYSEIYRPGKLAPKQPLEGV